MLATHRALALMSRMPAAQPKPPAAATIQLVVAGEAISVTVKRAPQARRFTLRVRAASRDVLLTMPARGTLAGAREFALRHASWVEERLGRLPQRIFFAPGAVVPVRGVEHVIAHRPGARRAAWVEAAGSGLLLCVSGELAHLPRRVGDYLKAEAKRDLDSAVRLHTSAIAKPARKITLRDTRSRWGSCSSRGSLNFSWRLILAPSFVLDYLAAHEVAHLVHMDHSPAFWRLAGKLAPDLQRAEAWLRQHGAGLHRFGGAPA